MAKWTDEHKAAYFLAYKELGSHKKAAKEVLARFGIPEATCRGWRRKAELEAKRQGEPAGALVLPEKVQAAIPAVRQADIEAWRNVESKSLDEIDDVLTKNRRNFEKKDLPVLNRVAGTARDKLNALERVDLEPPEKPVEFVITPSEQMLQMFDAMAATAGATLARVAEIAEAKVDVIDAEAIEDAEFENDPTRALALPATP
jgi:transposase-like protein